MRLSMIVLIGLSVLGGCLPLKDATYSKAALHASYGGFNHHAVTLGVGAIQHMRKSILHQDGYMTRSFGLAVRADVGDTVYYGVEGSAWGSIGVVGLGINAVYYTDFHGSSLYLRPEIGFGELPIGPLWLRTSIGWHIRISNHAPAELNDPQIGLRLTLPLDTAGIADS